MTRQFSVDLHKQQLTFSAAHFITFNSDVCERLHGHNYGVKCRVIGPLTEDRYVIDFIALRDRLAEIVGEFDHHVLLPMKHREIGVTKVDGEVIATFRERRWVFPEADCLLLPITNTTAEEIAEFICCKLIAKLESTVSSFSGVTRVAVSIDENQGQWATCEMDLEYDRNNGDD